MTSKKQVSYLLSAAAMIALAAAPVRANLVSATGGDRAAGVPLSAIGPATGSGAAVEADQFKFEALSDPIIGHSWDALFYVHAPDAFSHLGVVVGPGGELKGSPSMYGFADTAGPLPGWSQFFGPASGVGGSVALSFGPATNDLFWTAHFVGFNPEEQAFSMTLFSFNDLGSNVWDGAVADWDGTNWTLSGVPDLHVWEAFQATVSGGVLETVPLPSAALLGALGLGFACSLRKRLL